MKSELRYGIIGAGSMGREHIENIKVMGGATVTAISDPHVPSQEAALAMAPGAKVFTDHRALLESGLVDAVVIATPNDTHAAVLKDALESDLAVFVEKPLATTIEDLKSILAWDEKRSAMTWMGLEYRFMPPVAEAIARAKEGKRERFIKFQSGNIANRFTQRLITGIDLQSVPVEPLSKNVATTLT